QLLEDLLVETILRGGSELVVGLCHVVAKRRKREATGRCIANNQNTWGDLGSSLHRSTAPSSGAGAACTHAIVGLTVDCRSAPDLRAALAAAKAGDHVENAVARFGGEHPVHRDDLRITRSVRVAVVARRPFLSLALQDLVGNEPAAHTGQSRNRNDHLTLRHR